MEHAQGWVAGIHRAGHAVVEIDRRVKDTAHRVAAVQGAGVVVAVRNRTVRALPLLLRLVARIVVARVVVIAVPGAVALGAGFALVLPANFLDAAVSVDVAAAGHTLMLAARCRIAGIVGADIAIVAVQRRIHHTHHAVAVVVGAGVVVVDLNLQMIARTIPTPVTHADVAVVAALVAVDAARNLLAHVHRAQVTVAAIHIAVNAALVLLAPVGSAGVAVVANDHLRVADIAERSDWRWEALVFRALVAVVADHHDQLALVGDAVADVVGAGIPVLAVRILQAGAVLHLVLAGARCRVARVVGVELVVVAQLRVVGAVACRHVAAIVRALVVVIAGHARVDTASDIIAQIDGAGVAIVAVHRDVGAVACHRVAGIRRALDAVVASLCCRDAALELVAGVRRAGQAVVANDRHEVAGPVLVAAIGGAGVVVEATPAASAAAVVAALLLVAVRRADVRAVVRPIVHAHVGLLDVLAEIRLNVGLRRVLPNVCRHARVGLGTGIGGRSVLRLDPATNNEKHRRARGQQILHQSLLAGYPARKCSQT